MAGTAVNTPALAAGAYLNGGSNVAKRTPSMNSLRISAIADQLALHVQHQTSNDVVEFSNLCKSLSMVIDDAVASQEVPAKARDLPLLLKKVCQRRNEPLALAAVMILMISAKTACSSGWFLDRDSKELHHLADEISSNFCSTTDFKSPPSCSSSIISTIMSRFFPLMRMGHILIFLEMKPGFGTYVYDFHISQNMKSSPEAGIRLLVAQIDNMETSSCLVTPPNVNFLFNGKGVEKRNELSMDTGPQVPTPLSDVLNTGVNLFQAVGQFNGSYIVVVASMSMMSTPNHVTLPDYVQPVSASVDPDSEIIEGPSRISLNCPISFKRIKTPVKGLSCKHLQCFDYDNYLDINSRRPSWRCPHCNRHVCFPEIRIDQDMAKVLQEVGEIVDDVIIYSDGSWTTITETDDENHEPPDKTTDLSMDETLQPDSAGVTSDVTDMVFTRVHIDFPENRQNQPPDTNNPSEVNADGYWSRVLRSTYGLGPSSSVLNMLIADGFEPGPMDPILPDGLIPARVTHGGANRASSSSSSSNQYQFTNLATNEYGKSPAIVSYAVSRNPTAVQALPAQTSSSVPQQRPGNTMSRSSLNRPSATSHNSPVTPPFNIDSVNSSLGRQQQQFRNSNSNILESSRMPSSTATSIRPGESFGSVRPAPQFLNHQYPSQAHIPLNMPSRFTTEQTNTNQQHHTLNKQSNIQARNPSRVGQASSSVASSQHNHPTGAAVRNAQLAKPVQLPATPPLSVNPNASVDENWRPTGRMRGSLSGQAYDEALNNYVVRPTQQAQATRQPNAIPPLLQTIMANRTTPAIPPVTNQTSSSTPDDSRS